MLQPDEVTAMVRLHGLGWGAKRLSKEFGCVGSVRAIIVPPSLGSQGRPSSSRRSISVSLMDVRLSRRAKRR
jgi:hypothetical protein